MRSTYSTIRWILIGLAAIGFGLFAASPSSAAPALQASETPATETPSPTGTLRFGPTITPSATLGPPPSGGGRVAVPVLVVRAGPSPEWNAVGGLDYGAEIFPIARSENGNWVAIPWVGLTNNSPGWVLALLVNWDPALDLSTLPVYQPTVGTVTPGGATPVRPASTLTPSLTAPPAGGTLATAPVAASVTAILEGTPAPTITEAAPTDTPRALPTDTLEAAAAAPTTESSPAPRPTESTPTPASGSLPELPWPWIGGGALGLALVAYGLAFITGQQEAGRYHGGFVLDACPVCQSGTLQLEELRQPRFGIPTTQRTVRCDHCRSVLRQVRPGVWRYAVDGYVNPEMAEAYHGKTLQDRDMRGMAERARHFHPQMDETGPLDMSRAEEIVAELEARYLQERAEEEAALAEMEGEAEAGIDHADDSPEEDER